MVEREAVAAAYRLKIPNGWDQVLFRYQSLIIKETGILSIPLGQTPTAYELPKPFDAHIPNRDEAHKRVRKSPESVWYIDGSKMHTGNTEKSFCLNLGSSVTNLQAKW